MSELDTFHAEVRAWLEANRPADPGFLLPESFMEVGTDEQFAFLRDWQRTVYQAGYLGMAWPKEYGGGGRPQVYQDIVNAEMARAKVPFVPNTIGLNWAGPLILAIGTEAQKRRFLPPVVQGRLKSCFGVTEPNTGLNTTQLKTRAVRQGDRYVVHGQKVWISTAQVADKILLLARTTPIEECKSHSHGLSLFYTDLDRNKVAVRLIEKMGRKAVDSNELFIDGLEIPVEDRIGEEGQGFKYILHGMNPERILIGSEAIGIGRAALRKAATYAQERVVFDRPIGKNQGIQHPLAANWMELEAAHLMMLKAAWLYDQGRDCGAEANATKYLGAEAGFHACERAILTHGGFGYAKEYHVERYLREVMIARIAPVSREQILSYIAERVLGLPKSY